MVNSRMVDVLKEYFQIDAELPKKQMSINFDGDVFRLLEAFVKRIQAPYSRAVNLVLREALKEAMEAVDEIGIVFHPSDDPERDAKALEFTEALDNPAHPRHEEVLGVVRRGPQMKQGVS